MNNILLVGTPFTLLAAPAAAQYSVISTVDDTSAGTLRTAVTDSNVAGGANTVDWGAGGEGTISLLSDLPTIIANTTIDVTAAVSSVTLQGPGYLYLAGETTFKNGNGAQGWLITTGVGGAGSLTKTGAGTLTLTGYGSYSGGTYLKEGTLNVGASSLGSGALTFDGGTLQTPYTFTIGSSVTLNAGNGTFDLQGGTLTLTGVIGGAGALILNSTGTLKLTAANTYAGGTAVSNGVLNVNSDEALGAAAGAVTLNGGTLQNAGSFTTARSIVLAGNGAFDTNGYTMGVTGIISGAGGLTKLGPGVLTLGAVNTYGGATTVNEGTLRLDIDNALPATALTLANGANLDMTAQTVTQDVGAFVGAGTTKMTLRAGVTNLAVAGTANLSGGTLSVIAEDPLVQEGQTFTPLTHTGARTGEFTIVSPAAILYTPTYNPNDLTLTVSFVPFADVAGTNNQGAVGRALEPLRASPTGDMAAVLTSLYTLDAPHLQAALDQIGPVALASMRGMGMTAASVHASSLGRRMTLLADGGTSRRLPSYAVKGPSYPGTLSAAAPGDTEGWARSTGRALAQPWSVYMSGVGTTGKLQEANSASGTQPGYAFNTGGFVGGADYRVDDHLAAGFSLGYLRGHASLYFPASGTVENQSVRYGVYATRFGDGFHANLYLGGASDFFTTRRGIVFGDISRMATANSSGMEFNIDTSVGYDWRTAEWGIFSPFAGLDYDRLMIGSFQETGADSLNLKVDAQTSQSMRSSVGLRYSRDFNTDAMVATPYMSAGWRHEFKRQTQPISAQLASGSSSAFSVASGDFARDGTLLGFGLVLNRGRQIEIKLDYLGDFRSHYVESAYNASLRFKF
ncbi:MAG: hypothetical protein A2506_07135 [Elusimicrobia bacterium RIFOXYD12_FULL_66_9]|nr:MAG: hypothetical protein A2506_07135 [Elusimicrobia bacterium RIFOXYD12_FULL_66_9]